MSGGHEVIAPSDAQLALIAKLCRERDELRYGVRDAD